MVGHTAQLGVISDMTEERFMDLLTRMEVYFNGKHIMPARDSDFMGYYLEASDSTVTHIGVEESVMEERSRKINHLKVATKIDQPEEVDGPTIGKRSFGAEIALRVQPVS